MKALNKIPKFNNEKEQRVFWENNNSSDKVNWNNAQVATFSQLKTQKAIKEVRAGKNVGDFSVDELLSKN